MNHKGEHTLLISFRPWWWLWLVAWFFGSCVAVKNPPAPGPYVVANRVQITGNTISKAERRQLESQLVKFVADSLSVPERQVLGFSQIIRPPVFDSSELDQSLVFMKGYLNSEGFFSAAADSIITSLDTVKRKTRFLFGKSYTGVEVKNLFLINPGRQTRIDTVIFDFTDSVLAQQVGLHAAESKLRKGMPYTKNGVGVELDRISGQLRQQGYYYMSRSGLLATVDTTDPSLARYELDFIQQQVLALQHINNPAARIRISERIPADPRIFKQFVVDSITVYPTTKLTDNPDSLLNDTSFVTIPGGKATAIRQKEQLYLPKTIFRNLFLTPGSLYNDQMYFKTVNGFSQLGPWQQIDVRPLVKLTDSLGHIHFNLFLYPGRKQSMQVDLEGSQNNNISVANALAGRFLAVGVALTYRNRNVLKKATQSTTTLRTGLELNNTKSSGQGQLFQSLIVTGNQSFAIPRLLWPMRFIENKPLDSRKTYINLGGSYTDRFQFFKQTSINANLTWEWRKKSNIFSVSFPLFETVDTTSTDSLKQVIKENPTLAYSFTPGNILSIRGTWERILKYTPKNHSGFFRIASEITLPGNPQLFGKDFFKFLRLEGQFVHRIKLVKSSWDFRFFSGVGWDLGPDKQANLPFFRQFVTGGSNSMRAWAIRQLGLGNSLASDTASFTDRFGDIQIELNAEFRHRLARIAGFNFDGAFFADIGNIWNHNPAADGLGKFDWRYLGRDLAIALGYGIRWDLDFLLIRFDGGFKLKDPVREGSGWLQEFTWKSTNRLGTNKRSNLAVQFGIGYPF